MERFAATPNNSFDTAVMSKQPADRITENQQN